MTPQLKHYCFLICAALSTIACLAWWIYSDNGLAKIHVGLGKMLQDSPVVDNTAPFIFIGGFPRSGTTLMRAMLDAHPEVRCGEETRVIPRILTLRNGWTTNENEWKRLKLLQVLLQQAGLNDAVLNAAMSAFIVRIIVGHGDPAPRLCNKDPFTLKATAYLSELFPNAKFILMIRDGRATVHSIYSRNISITDLDGLDVRDFRHTLLQWNADIQSMYEQCTSIGVEKCIPIYYEQLVLHPAKEMKRLLNFLHLPWNEAVLHHEMFIGKEISLSKDEWSTDQVVKPVYLDALKKWVGNIPNDVVSQMSELAPMLRILGYDPSANPPNYEEMQRKTDQFHWRA